MRVFVLLFNARTENEGIYSIWLRDGEGVERNCVLMFEDEDDATRYAGLLEAQDFPLATVEPIEDDEVREFCKEAGYECQLVAQGELAIPMETNRSTDDMSWQVEGEAPPTPSEEDAGSMSAAELERIRRRLEGLL
ncbi:MAG: DUF3110 domain-containing protein [Limnothrix sp. BL-A-16]|jgi:hypothetical protein